MHVSTSQTAAPRTPARVPEDTVVYAVGDIHGCAPLLDALHEQIRADAGQRKAARRVIIYLGDYIDRGADSAGVIDRLLDGPLAGFEAVHLKGNHEAFLMSFLRDSFLGPSWLANGGVATLASYGVATEASGPEGSGFEAQRRGLAARLPERHRRFLSGLAKLHVEGDYAFVHAGVRPGISLDRQRESDLLWIRDAFLKSPHFHGKLIVHGHTITQAPDVRPNRIGIDTGAYNSSVLTALVLEGEERGFLHT